MNVQITSLEKKSTQDQSLYDVIIVGAGPVGLFLAWELALAKCSVLILERAVNPQSPLKQLPFGIRGLSSPTIEAFYRRGLLQELEIHKRLKNPHQKAGHGSRRQVGHFAGIPFHEGDVDTSQWKDRLPSSTVTSLISEIAELESVLARRAEVSGVQIKRGLAITDFQQTGDGVAVQCGEQSFRSKWLVGCDGSRSVVRKAGGFEFAGTEPEFTGYSIQLDLADPEKLGAGRRLTPTGMYFQSQPGYLVMVEFDGGAGHHTEPVTLERLQETLRRVSNTDVTINALQTATTWTDRARQATAYRNARVASREQFGLFETALRDPNRFSETLARLHALLGVEQAGVGCPDDTHRPDMGGPAQLPQWLRGHLATADALAAADVEARPQNLCQLNE